MNKIELLSTLKAYFQASADTYDIDMAFLYGSCAEGLPRNDSDVDIAVLFSHEKDEDTLFDIINSVTLELTDLLKKESNVLYIDRDLSKPMLHYNAIVHGIPVFMRDFTGYADMKLKALHRMEDFSIFGTKWQAEIVRKRLELLNHA